MDPLFVPSLAELQANLRLTNISSETDIDVNTLIERAVRTVRVNFRQRLSQSRIAQIQGYTQASPVDPDEDTEYIRELAELTEIQWVWVELSTILPMLFSDSSADANEVLQDEAPFRKASQREITSQRRQYLVAIETAICILVGDQDLDDASAIRATTLSPSRSRRVGDSIRRRRK